MYTYFVAVCVCGAAAVGQAVDLPLSRQAADLQLSDEANAIREQIVRDLGLSATPDVHKANVSESEYREKLSIYQQSVEQTKAVKRLREHFQTHLQHRQPETTVLTKPGKLRVKRSVESAAVNLLMFNVVDLVSGPGSVLINSALLSVRLVRKPGSSSSSSRVCSVQVVSGTEGITTDCVEVMAEDFEDNTAHAQLDVKHAVQAWVLDEAANKGLLLVSDAWELEDSGSVAINVELVSGLVVRQRRDVFLSTELLDSSPGLTDCQRGGGGRAGRKCCRQHMRVNLRELQGFEFIMQPAEFDAYYCVGKCPARFRPLNDHSLLQSLIHLKGRDNNAAGGGKANNVKKPCCSPSKFESIDILHLDELDSSKLKVTNWKNIIVSECACA